MSRRLMEIIAAISGTITLIGSIIWVITAADENGVVHFEGNEMYVYTFLVLGLIGMVTGSIALKATNEKGDKINKKTLISGVIFAAIFLVWRLSVTL
ncbi:hypothetical protein J7E38_16900 [Bacillus sp. ISL-35]|uniref:hypothetical protein n=1 Tax=Bacillus sp. ISL-35 TaxID=2819122 RepID=UPI001BE8D450|nr:hypothetical protein [Bacillus sp. ISL-35]MBT2680691.1 hypothetical protein [Bacillus sp. ISL-35]MBT2702678.1 hypothetical protein [Chryseobacterium sp. ISL-80]